MGCCTRSSSLSEINLRTRGQYRSACMPASSRELTGTGFIAPISRVRLNPLLTMRG
jgi:hypothetical protein